MNCTRSGASASRKAGAIIIEEPGNRIIVREGDREFIRHDETEGSAGPIATPTCAWNDAAPSR